MHVCVCACVCARVCVCTYSELIGLFVDCWIPHFSSFLSPSFVSTDPPELGVKEAEM